MFEDLTGQKFNRWTVIGLNGKNKHGKITWKCKCSCGNPKTIIVIGSDLRTGKSKSCGCIHSELLSKRNKKHSQCGTRIYNIWCGMKSRCYNPEEPAYKNYGARGIKICDEWLNDFQAFYNWSMSHGYSDNLTIDRIDVNGNYEPENCKWSSDKEQANNTRRNHYVTYSGKTQTLKQWSEETGINYSTLRTRINNLHWSVEKALSTP